MKRIGVPLILFLLSCGPGIAGEDLASVKARGVLRHLGVPYANFVTGTGDGLSVELMRRFAAHLGVKYEFVQTTWNDVIPDLVGHEVVVNEDDASPGPRHSIRGDVIANGLTILPWREKVVTFTMPTFPTQVWLISRVDAGFRPIKPSGDIERDIAATKALMIGRVVLGKSGTCLDPSLYDLAGIGVKPKLFEGSLNDLAPAVMEGNAPMAILDVPDALVALEKWPGQILILGPVSKPQQMAVAFRKDCPGLHREFNSFFRLLLEDGTYARLVEKYYPAVFDYYHDFFLKR